GLCDGCVLDGAFRIHRGRGSRLVGRSGGAHDAHFRAPLRPPRLPERVPDRGAISRSGLFWLAVAQLAAAGLNLPIKIPMPLAAAPTSAQLVSNWRSIRCPAITGPIICATDMSDCVSPSTT